MTTTTDHNRTKARYRHMDVEITVHQCQIPKDERSRMQAELELLAEQLLEFPVSQLRFSIVYHPGQAEYHAQAWLKVPGKRFVSGRYSPWLDYSIMRCLAKLRRHVENYNADPDAIRQAQRSVDQANHVIPPTEHIDDALGLAIQRQDYREFRRALIGYEDLLRAQVANWVGRYPQMTRQLGETIDVDDIVEEVFLMAFDEFPERLTEQTMSEWIRHLIDPAVKAIWHNPEEREAAEFARTFSAMDEPSGQQPPGRRTPK
jgi:hypothetical protein